ncbi:SLAF1 protein, partial [Bucco capensis]|nr:SLAF1 protein [Bucco capensis]
EEPGKKQILLSYHNGTYSNNLEGRIHFHQLNFSLEILNTSRQDRQLYEYVVSKRSEEKVWQIQLEVYEAVLNPTIELLTWALTNDSCSLSLKCTAERGDNLSYSWDCCHSIPLELCFQQGSILHLSYLLPNSSITCSCRASNPVSSSITTFTSSQCSSKQGGKDLHLLIQLIL